MSKNKKKLDLTKALAASLVSPMPKALRDDLLADRAFGAKIGVSPVTRSRSVPTSVPTPAV